MTDRDALRKLPDGSLTKAEVNMLIDMIEARDSVIAALRDRIVPEFDAQMRRVQDLDEYAEADARES